MARRSRSERRGRAGVTKTFIGVVSGAFLITGFLTFLVMGGLAGASGSGADQPAGDPHEADRVIVCESGMVQTEDGVETSSSVAYRVPDGVEVPEGCREG